MSKTLSTGKKQPVTDDVSTLPAWVSRWATLVNELHKRPLEMSCPECGRTIELTRDAVDAHGITIHCEACQDYLQHRTPQAFLADLEASGVPIDE